MSSIHSSITALPRFGNSPPIAPGPLRFGQVTDPDPTHEPPEPGSQNDPNTPQDHTGFGGFLAPIFKSFATLIAWLERLSETAKRLLGNIMGVTTPGMSGMDAAMSQVRQAHQDIDGATPHDATDTAPDMPARRHSDLLRRILYPTQLEVAKKVFRLVNSPLSSNNVILQSNDPLALDATLDMVKSHYRQPNHWLELDFNSSAQNLPRDLLLEGELTPWLADARNLSGCPADQPLVLVLKNLDYKYVQLILQNSQKIALADPMLKLVLPVENNFYQQSKLNPPLMPGLPPLPEIKLEGRVAQTFQTVNTQPVTDLNTWLTLLNHDPAYLQIQEQAEVAMEPEAEQALIQLLIKNGINNYTHMLSVLDAIFTTLNPPGAIGDNQITLNPRMIEKQTERIQQITKQVMEALYPEAEINSRVKRLDTSQIYETFNDVVGLDEAKEVLNSAIEELRYPNMYAHFYQNNPNALQNTMLLHGPPGNGKTMLARAMAKELEEQVGAKVSFLTTTGEQLTSKYMNHSSELIRDLGAAIDNDPNDFVVLFIDEIDALGQRTQVQQGVDTDNNARITSLLNIIQGIQQRNKRVLIMTATNKKENVDEAILDRMRHQIKIDKPTTEQRQQQIENHFRKLFITLQLEKPDQWDSILQASSGFNGRGINNVLINLQQKLIKQLSEEQQKALERDPNLLKTWKLTLSENELITALEDYAQTHDLTTDKKIGFWVEDKDTKK